MDSTERDVLADTITEWAKCHYRIIEVTDELGIKVKLIASVIDSDIEWYNPVSYGRKIKLTDGYVNKSYQPKNEEEEDWPPHIALARLDLWDNEAIVKFTSKYGLLGLREVPSWRDKEPFFAQRRIKKIIFSGDRSDWYNLPVPKERPENWDFTKTYCEPLEVFQRAVAEYQKVIRTVVFFCKTRSERRRQILFQVFKIRAKQYFQRVVDDPDYDYGPKARKSFKSLLEVCYYRISLDLQEGVVMYRRCKRKKCNKVFPARLNNDYYCRPQCRKANSAANRADRQIKPLIKELQNKGKISIELAKMARQEIDKLFKGGIKDKDKLKEEVLSFFNNEGVDIGEFVEKQ